MVEGEDSGAHGGSRADRQKYAHHELTESVELWA